MSTTHSATRCVAFIGKQLLAEGEPAAVALACRQALEAGAAEPMLVFDAHNSRLLEFDLRGTEADVLTRLHERAQAEMPLERSRGRPRLGVTAREVTLLPRHWDWLGAQPGGASAALRRLVEQARRDEAPAQREREASEAVDRFMQAMTGNLPGHEEASRAFWRGERERFAACIGAWPCDVRAHLQNLADNAWAQRQAKAPAGLRQETGA